MTRFPGLVGIIAFKPNFRMLGNEQVIRRLLMVTFALVVITFYVVAMVMVFGDMSI